MGVSYLLGMCAVLVLFPISVRIAGVIKVRMQSMYEARDARVKQTEAVLSAMRCVKSLAHEQHAEQARPAFS